MKTTGISVLLVIAFAFAPPALAGRTEPIRNPSAIPIADWVCGVKKPGEVRAILYVGRHMAECLIEFDTSTFSVKYVNSSTLLYDADKNRIHRNYNLWVTELIRSINVTISAISE